MIRVCAACNRPFEASVRASGRAITCSPECSAERKRQWSRQHPRREQSPPGHLFKDPGPAIAEPDWQPRTVRKNPESILAAAFGKIGADYGGPIDALDAHFGRAMVGAES